MGVACPVETSNALVPTPYQPNGYIPTNYTKEHNLHNTETLY